MDSLSSTAIIMEMETARMLTWSALHSIFQYLPQFNFPFSIIITIIRDLRPLYLTVSMGEAAGRRYRHGLQQQLNAATFSQDLSSQLAGQSNVKFKWNYAGSWGYYWAVDDISITGTGPNQWTGSISNVWDVPANWSQGIVPTGSEPAIISSGANNWPLYAGDLVVGSDCGDLTLSDGAQMAVTGNFTINVGQQPDFQQRRSS